MARRGVWAAMWCVAAGTAGAATGFTTTYLGNFTASNAAFLNIDPFAAPGGATLIISQFTGNPLAPDQLGSVPNLGGVVTGAAAPVVQELSSTIDWPNDNSQLTPADGIAGFQGLLVAGGFLVPPKTVGGITLLGLTPNGTSVTSQTKVSVDKGNALFDGWFYHRAHLTDVDGDGYVDILTARATKPLIGTPGGELVWLRQPPGVPNPLDPSVVPWQETVLMNGTYSPDIFTELASLRNDGDVQLFYASFFTGGGLAFVQCVGCANGTNTWAKAALEPIVIDASIGPGFDVQVVDLNGDGSDDLLVANHVDNATLSGVFAYVAPAPPTPLTAVGAWTKHVLASGFIVREPGLPGTQAAPGAARPLARCTNSTATKPLITVAGDGDQRFYILAPNSDDPTDWSYSLTLVWDCAGTVGRQAAADVDGDGCPELFVPCYDTSIVQMFRIAS